MALKDIFKDENDINEKSVVGFASFLVMVVFALLDIVTGIYGKELVIQDYIYKTLSGKGSGKKRKAILNMLDRDFREIGGLSLPEARVAVSDTAQLSGVDDASLKYVGEITGGRMPISNHPTYAQGIEGQPVGVLKEKNLSLLDLLDDADLNRGLTNPKVWSGIDRKNIDPKDMYILRTSPKSGIITEEKLRNLEKLGLLDTATENI